MKKIIILVLVGAMFLVGCGSVRSAKSLYRMAKSTHGACTIVSENETDKKTEVVLHDKLQDFDYTVTSSINEISIDGSSFGSVPGTTDGFMVGLKQKVVSNVEVELNAACSMSGMHYEVDSDSSSENLLIIYAGNAGDGERAAVKCAGFLQEQNKDNRLDGLMIVAGSNETDKYYKNEHFGSIKLPDITWRTPEDEDIDYYTEMAHQQTDKNAKFLRVEKGIFADTEADLDRVVRVLGTGYPKELNSPVTFYYFESSEGREYYLCNFNYYKDDEYHYEFYTNYKEN